MAIDENEAPVAPIEESGETVTYGASAEDIQKAQEAGWNDQVAINEAEDAREDVEWAGEGKVYAVEWKDEFGDVGPEIPELEQMLFATTLRNTKGEFFDNLVFEAQIEGPENLRINKFEDAGLHPVILQNLKLAHYDKPTPIQSYTIPAVMKGYDVVAVAQTGSGKTAAYLIPILSNLMGKAKKLAAPRPNTADPSYRPGVNGVRAEPLVVIVMPTRELAIQIFDEARRMCYRSMLRPCVTYGGFPMKTTVEQLQGGCDVLIATPGRLCALMDKPHLLTMSRVKYTVIDEADEMLDTDWSDELAKIMGGGDTNEDADHVYLMFSATFPKGARALAREYMAEDYVRVRIGRAGQTHKNIRQNVIYVDPDQKRQAVYDLLFASPTVRTIIFVNSKPGVDLLDDFLYNHGLPCTSMHSDRSQKEREDALRSFRTGKKPILIATGVSSRGWDIKDVGHIINYDLPSAMYGGITEYIHRIGRTARIGNQGLATSFYNDKNEELAQDLVNILTECECEVPDFLEHLKPEDGNIQFDDNSDDEGGEGEGFGAAEGFAESGQSAAAAFGGFGDEGAADAGFQADSNFPAQSAAEVQANIAGW